MRALACLACFPFLVAAASARAPSATPPVAKAQETVQEVGPVHGRVLTPWGVGIARHRVSMGGQRAYTDGEGRFSFEHVPATYDITVTERDNRQATAYHGLTRRDPVLAHLATKGIADGFRSESSLDKLATDSGRIAGTVELLKARPATLSNTRRDAESLTFSYLAPNYYPALRPGAIYLGSCATAGAFDCELPDLTSLGGEYCMAIGESLSKLRAMRCGGKIGMTGFSIPAQPPAPQITVDDDGHNDRMITWTVPGGVGARVYELNLGYDFEGLNVRVYTGAQSFTWSEVEALGVDFRRDDPRLRGIKVTALLPYTSMDDLVSGRGPMAMGTSWRRVESDEVVLPLPAGFKAAAAPARPGKFDPRDRRSVPACPSPDTVQWIGVGDLRPSMASTWVTVRGSLGFDLLPCDDTGSGCCNDAAWWVVDAKSPRSGVLLERAEDSGVLVTVGCNLPEPPQIEVIATGLLVVPPDDPRPARRPHPARPPRYILDQVSVCAVLSLRKP